MGWRGKGGEVRLGWQGVGRGADWAGVVTAVIGKIELRKRIKDKRFNLNLCFNNNKNNKKLN